ncbi:2-dehydro-3-deoxy-6-phosphogalactonate aldolase [Aestuariibacter sp. A3R04]|uniref:2-dehydro-3-deoxy-6-phosphogalactonate aldolase n=1 Tax=Aestuariibacter sp. A3R04 TaxID=2841571 RepID=UPI001C0A20AE|nr:2-dehydro-3-deoxy-6-phosphogalactonate aldolase [Aestuariibacter sp. A3R04]MBU3021340.1 2-dehydro-3-deoxy-6-phosphogalactonate aldolase [Aestuariibacter sp. A3R04]
MPSIKNAFGLCPMIAIIRGAETSSIPSIGKALLRAGVKIVEVPLNSPSPYDSIAMLKETVGEAMVVGAGTVLNPNQVIDVAEAGGEICVSPNTDCDVIEAALSAGIEPIPGYQTPTEAFKAIHAGASWLKCYPVNCIGPSGIKALRDVIADSVKLIAVGGVSAENVEAYLQAGCNGVGLAGSLFRPGDSAEQVEIRARAMVEAIRRSIGVAT